MNIDGEWREIPGHSGFFINEHGVVASANHGREAIILDDDGAVSRPKGRVLLLKRWGSHRFGYPMVGLHDADGRTQNHTVHALVAKTFLGERPLGYEVAHRDGDPQNPHVSNLRWATSAENSADQDLHGTRPRGENHGTAKLTDAQALEIRRLYATGEYRQRDLSERFGVSQQNVSRVVNGLRRAWQGGPLTAVGSGARKLGQLRTARERRPRVNDTMAREIRILYATGEWTQEDLAKKFGVSRLAILLVTTGKTFKSAGGPITRFGPGPRKKVAA